jgi:diguanylate cyclase (GGDEF)-like protein
MEYLVAVAIFICLSLFFLSMYLLKKSKNCIGDFLNLQTNIAIIATNDKTLFINRAGLKFFGFDTIEDFQREIKSINRLFLEEDNCVTRYSHGKHWLEKIYNTKAKLAKVKIKTPLDRRMDYYFYIQVSKLRGDNYLLIFTNITKLESDKDMIRKLADYDPLTNIYSRVKFKEMFETYVNRASSFNEKFSIIIFDIDHFKSINDNYGHNIGDRVLIELTSIVKSVLKERNMRKNSIFSRWGGEEFIILLQATTKEEAKKIANILREEIKQYTFPEVGRVTCSFGVTQFRTNDIERDIFQRADEALYEAKEGGRDRVVVK